MDLSVIICTWNRSKALTAVLKSLEASVVPPRIQWEVLVVDNNSKDDTRAVCESFIQRNPGRFRYLFAAQQGKSLALNTGVASAQGDILAFTDDDVTVHPHWLAELIGTMEEFNCSGVGGKIIPVWNAAKPSWFEETGPHRLSPAIVSFDLGDQPVPMKIAPFGANVAFKKTAFQKHGGFRTDLGLTAQIRIGGEDTEFCRRLMKAGESLYYAPAALIYHPVEKRRTEKSYFEAWYLGRGRASVREEGIPPDAVRYFRVPRYLLGCFFKNLLKSALATSSKLRFYHKLRAYENWGQILESRRSAPGGK